MKIEVTKRDIELANQRLRDGKVTAENCPVALALKRRTKKKIKVDGLGGAVIGGLRIVCLPRKAIDFIWEFDNCVRVKPFTFEL